MDPTHPPSPSTFESSFQRHRSVNRPVPSPDHVLSRCVSLCVAPCVAATLLAAALLTAAPAAAQDEPDPWSLKTDLGLSLIRGSSETSTISASSRLEHRDGNHIWAASGDFRRSTADSTVTVNRARMRLEYEYRWGERTYYSMRLEGSYNRPAGLNLRVSPATSVGYEVVDSEKLTVSMAGGGRFIRDRFVDGTGDRGLYLSGSESLIYVVADGTKLHQSLDVTPKAGNPEDFLYTGNVRLVTSVTEEVGLEVSVEDEFESRPFVDPTTGEARSKHEVSFFTELTFQL